MSEQLIRIVPSKDPTKKGASFNPGTLSAQQNDLVVWNNTTNETHQPWPVVSNDIPITPGSVNPDGSENLPSANYLCDPIPPDSSSRPSFVIVPQAGNPPWTINYFCASHPERTWERGTISAQAQAVVNEPPDNPDS
jgi:hypothetical protein